MRSVILNQVLALIYKTAQQEGQPRPSSGRMSCDALAVRYCMKLATHRLDGEVPGARAKGREGGLQQGGIP